MYFNLRAAKYPWNIQVKLFSRDIKQSVKWSTVSRETLYAHTKVSSHFLLHNKSYRLYRKYYY